MPHAPFSNDEIFHQAFADGLVRMLGEASGLGTFILVLNNALADPRLQQRLAESLRQGFERLAAGCRDALRSGHAPDQPADDLLVFLELMAIGLEAIPACRYRPLGPFEAQFNLVRALRPARASKSAPQRIHQAFDPDKFHFDKPFIDAERLWHGTLCGQAVDLLYNKFPFVEHHALLVPERGRRRPQFLTREDHLHAWRVCETLGAHISGVGLGYNSLGAFASVNHLHFQLFARQNPLPVQLPVWQHNGGATAYPTGCERFDATEAAWQRIEGLQAGNQPFNLVYSPGQMLAFPRRLQGSYETPQCCPGQAWYELAGGVVAFDPKTFAALDETMLTEALGRCRLPPAI